MPVVSLYGQPMVNAPRAEDARFRAADAGDGGLGRSVQNLANVAGQYAEHEAKVRAEDLMLQADQRMKAVADQFKGQMGRNAMDGRKAADGALSKAYDEILGATDDPLIKAHLKPALDRYQSLYVGQISAHGVDQERVYNKEVGSARAANFAQNAVDNRNDPDVSSQFVASMRRQLHANLALDGMDDPDVVEQHVRKAESGVHASIADAYLASGDIDTAEAYFEAHRDEMIEADEIGIMDRLRGPLQKREAYGDASTVIGAAWDDSAGTATNYADPLRGLGKGVSSAFGESRSGGAHNGVDFAAPKGTPIHSIGAGKVIRSGHDDRSGNFIVVDHGDGTTSSYSHMDGASPLRPGDTVTPDSVIGRVGSTGRSTGPHLHLVVKKGGAVVDPEKVIGAAQQSPRRHDLDALLARADAMAGTQGWSFERRERAKDEIRRRVSMDETLKAREEDEADRAAQDLILSRRDGFTDPGLIPSDVWGRMSAAARDSAIRVAENNRKPKEPVANGPEIMMAHAIMYSDPDKFRDMDLTQFVGKVTNAELDHLVSEKAKLRAPANAQPEVSARSQVSSTIGYHTKTDRDLDRALDPKSNPEAYGRVARDMEAFLRGITGGKRKATDAELDAAFNRATMNVIVEGGGWFGSDKVTRRFDLEGGETYRVDDMPAAVRQRIIERFRSNLGESPSDAAIARIYVRFKGQKGYW